MRHSASAFIEVVAVLFVVGLLAVVAIPDSQKQEPDTQYRALIASLEHVRTALDRCWADHDATYPPLEAVEALSGPAKSPRNRSGLGAYLDSLPKNPFSGGNKVSGPQAPVGTSDWVYDPAGGVFKANDSPDHRAL